MILESLNLASTLRIRLSQSSAERSSALHIESITRSLYLHNVSVSVMQKCRELAEAIPNAYLCLFCSYSEVVLKSGTIKS